MEGEGPALTGYVNFRDLGGHRTPAGTIRRGQLFRSDTLGHCDPSQVAHLVEERGIRTIVDLRHEQEIVALPLTALADAGVVVEHVPLVDPARSNWQPLQASASLCDRYEYMLDTAGTRFVVALRVIATDTRRPLVFQCTAGKDRTGLLAAMLLGVLGVEHEAIVADYARTSDALPTMMARWEARHGPEHLDNIRPYLTADATTMRDTLARLEARYGGMEQYVREHGLTADEVDHLRVELVEPDVS